MCRNAPKCAAHLANVHQVELDEQINMLRSLGSDTTAVEAKAVDHGDIGSLFVHRSDELWHIAGLGHGGRVTETLIVAIHRCGLELHGERKETLLGTVMGVAFGPAPFLMLRSNKPRP